MIYFLCSAVLLFEEKYFLFAVQVYVQILLMLFEGSACIELLGC